MAQPTTSKGEEPKNTRTSRSKLGRKPKGFTVGINSDINQPPQLFSCVSPSKSLHDLNLRCDLSQKNVTTFEGPIESIYGNPDISSVNQSLMSTSANLHSLMESSVTQEPEKEKSSVKQETGQARLLHKLSDRIEEDSNRNIVGRSVKRYQSKNIFAERRRRKKLKDNLFALRAVVPKITKMDRASILGDAIVFVKELQNQVKDLRSGLRALEEEGEMNNARSSINNIQLELPPIQNAVLKEAKPEKTESLSGSKMGIRLSSNSKQIPDSAIVDDEALQMEVEVTQIDGNKFFIKVLCKHKRRGFVSLMEAIDALGLEVTNANITTFRGLVLNVLRIEKRDNGTVEADQIRDLLLELIHNSIRGWTNSGKSEL